LNLTPEIQRAQPEKCLESPCPSGLPLSRKGEFRSNGFSPPFLGREAARDGKGGREGWP